MPDLLYILGRWWKLIVVSSFIASLVAFTVTMLLPKKYLSTVTALPSNAALTDKSKLFNQNIQSLYPEVGSVDELDKIEGTVELDTLFLMSINSLNLLHHYKKSATPAGVYKAIKKLKRNTKISRSEFGELKIQAWDTDKEMSAAIANNIVQNLQLLHRNIQKRNSEVILQKLIESRERLSGLFFEISDSLKRISIDDADLLKGRKSFLAEEILEVEKIITRYEAAISATPDVLLIVESARPSFYPDKPKVWQSVLITFLSSCFFFFLLAVFIESRKEEE